jgi:hypothetical protein
MRRRWLVVYVRGVWMLRDSAGASAPMTTKAAAVAAGRRAARAHHAAGGLAQLVVRRRDGRVHYEHTYGRDPVRAPG